MSDEYWAVANLGCTNATRTLGDVDLEFRFPTEHTTKAQQDILSDLAGRACHRN